MINTAKARINTCNAPSVEMATHLYWMHLDEIDRLRSALRQTAGATMSMCPSTNEFPRMLKRIAVEALGEEST